MQSSLVLRFDLSSYLWCIYIFTPYLHFGRRMCIALQRATRLKLLQIIPFGTLFDIASWFASHSRQMLTVLQSTYYVTILFYNLNNLKGCWTWTSAGCWTTLTQQIHWMVRIRCKHYRHGRIVGNNDWFVCGPLMLLISSSKSVVLRNVFIDDYRPSLRQRILLRPRHQSRDCAEDRQGGLRRKNLTVLGAP